MRSRLPPSSRLGIISDASGPSGETALRLGPTPRVRRGTWPDGSLASTYARDTAWTMSDENVDVVRRG